MRGLELPALDRRLRKDSAAPLAIAFSGGGDSLALLLLTSSWAEAHGRRLLALTVDHGLNPASAGWTERCRATADRLGVAFETLRWEGAKPSTGLPAAARAARHALLADAAREAGAKVILMGHTADDLAEAAAMRSEGSSVGDPTEWAPSPAWPQGRDVFLLRPLLGLRRQALRDWLTAAGETWIDDPANEDPRFARARARLGQSSPQRGEGDHAQHGGGESPHGLKHRGTTPCTDSPPPLFGRSPAPAELGRIGGVGALFLPHTSSAGAIAAACLCAGGTSRPPRGDRLERLVRRLRSGEAFTATLAGARIETTAEAALFGRDPGRAGIAALPLKPGRPTVWDGRFDILADRPGLTVGALAGHAARLPGAQRERLRDVPASVRPTLPVIFGENSPTCPILAEHPGVRARPLVLARFEAAVGGVDSEPGV